MISKIPIGVANEFMMENKEKYLLGCEKADVMYGYYLDGEIVGVGGLAGSKIMAVVVRKDCRKRGIGASLIRHLINRGGDYCYATAASEPIFARFNFVPTKCYQHTKRMKKEN